MNIDPTEPLGLENTEPMPRFSVIIPANDCAEQLQCCLAALAQSDFSDFECIVVDDGSTPALDVGAAADKPLQAGRDARSTGRATRPTECATRLIRLDQRGGPARARNRGAAAARGEILAFFDADVCVHSDVLSRFDVHFASHPQTTAVIGSYDLTPADRGFVSQYKNLFHHYVHQHSRRDASTFWAGCGAIRRQAFTELGGFDETYHRPSIEDIELGSRLKARGYGMTLDPTIQVTHLKRWTLARMVRVDLFDRALPWLRLMLRNRSMPSDLNTTVVHRVSVVLVWTLLITGLAAPLYGSRIAATLIAALLLLNLDLYRFFARERGFWFVVRAVLLHWLYYLYCGLAVGLTVADHLLGLSGQRRQRPATSRTP